MREGLSEALQEMKTLKLLLQESHAEGERLRSALKEKKEEVERKNLPTVTEEALHEREEVEELRARAKALETRRREMIEEVEEARQAKDKAEEKRREVEERWRSKVEEMKETLKTLSREIQTLKEREQVWRSRVQEAQREVEESRAELEEYKTQREEVDGLKKRRRDQGTDEEGGGEEIPEEEQEEEQTSLLQEKEEMRRLLRQREAEVYTLTQRAEELHADRERVRLALERTEAAMIGYRERAHQQEQSPGAESNPDEAVADRLVVLQRLVAELELNEKQVKKKNSHLKRERDRLRDTLRQVEEERLRFRQQLTDSRPQDTTEEERLRSRVRELEDQVSQLRLSLAVDQQQRAEFIQQSTKNSQWLLSLRSDLTDSLATVTRRPIPSVLESETQRLDRSLREEELRMSLGQS
ncbi:hypothetical protein D5F01_LYC01466 [Larimichthys crocea]|uniref:Trichohyalin-like n=1 Tax=Larimichthys crocea TaxID=215358 RepID=A0A6G0J649_LARCR|nr:hypothetical protein D5F01_LYC01466 [Larimichthys crocea]